MRSFLILVAMGCALWLAFSEADRYYANVEIEQQETRP